MKRPFFLSEVICLCEAESNVGRDVRKDDSLGKALLCKHENWSLDPQCPHKSNILGAWEVETGSSVQAD